MMQFVIILYEAAIIYDRERAARRCAFSGRVSYLAHRTAHPDYLLSLSIKFASETIAI